MKDIKEHWNEAVQKNEEKERELKRTILEKMQKRFVQNASHALNEVAMLEKELAEVQSLKSKQIKYISEIFKN